MALLRTLKKKNRRHTCELQRADGITPSFPVSRVSRRMKREYLIPFNTSNSDLNNKFNIISQSKLNSKKKLLTSIPIYSNLINEETQMKEANN